MRLLSSLLLLPLLPHLGAAQQIPLMDIAAGWYEKAKSYIPTGVESPLDAAANAIADKRVTRINQGNWQEKLSPRLEGEEEWMVYLTGGNKSCFGRCGPVDQAWNESVPLLAALPSKAGTPPLHLGIINCEKEEVLCTAWAATVPCVYHFTFPQKPAGDVPAAKSPLHVVLLNTTTTTALTFAAIPSKSQSKYLNVEEYTGALHPVDGAFANYQLLIPLGYLLWGFGTTPSWLIMIAISFFSRQIMSKRAVNRMAGPTIPAGAPAPAAAPAQPRAAPGSAQKGGKKRK